jgi:hypothetical protein
MTFLLKVGASLVAILLLAWLARRLRLGGDVRIRDEAHARTLANEAVFGFDPVDIAIDKAGIGALLRDVQGRQMLLRRHGAQFVGRILDPGVDARLDRTFLTIGTGEKSFGQVTLNLGDAAQVWAAGLRHVRA